MNWRDEKALFVWCVVFWWKYKENSHGGLKQVHFAVRDANAAVRTDYEDKVIGTQNMWRYVK